MDEVLPDRMRSALADLTERPVAVTDRGFGRLAAAEPVSAGWLERNRPPLFDFDNQIRLLKYASMRIHQRRARIFIFCIRKTRARAGTALNHDLMPALRQLISPAGQQRHAIFLFFNLLRHADNHARTLSKHRAKSTDSHVWPSSLLFDGGCKGTVTVR